MAEIDFPRLLLIAGVGRNSGKTHLAVKLIEKFSQKGPIIAIKISPHIHDADLRSTIIFSHKHYTITEERSTETGKDSSLFLKAGALQVFYMQSEDFYLKEAWQELQRFIPEKCPVICEGGWMRNHVNPGLFIHCNVNDITVLKDSAKTLIPLADAIVNGKSDNFPDSVYFENEKWGISNLHQ